MQPLHNELEVLQEAEVLEGGTGLGSSVTTAIMVRVYFQLGSELAYLNTTFQLICKLFKYLSYLTNITHNIIYRM